MPQNNGRVKDGENSWRIKKRKKVVNLQKSVKTADSKHRKLPGKYQEENSQSKTLEGNRFNLGFLLNVTESLVS